MQGRLVPPVDGRIQAFPADRWADEFPAARLAGLECIEWIFDASDNGANPIRTAEGIARMRRLSEECGVAVRSLCADLLMERPLVRVSEEERRHNESTFLDLLERCVEAGIRRVVLPFVDRSAMTTTTDQDIVVDTVRRALEATAGGGIELHLEVSLAPAETAALLARLPEPRVKINYDSGNSASLGYDAREEFAAYGNRIGSVHIKDRKRGGGTVPLGDGDADLPLLFALLRKIDYQGDLILQVARSDSGGESAWAQRNREIVQEFLKRE